MKKGLFLAGVLLILSGFASAVTLFGNTTINSSLTQNTFFELSSGVCVFDEAVNNTYCAGNNTLYVNQTIYVNQTVNQTVYPNCSVLNETVQLNYAGFGVSEKLSYACLSGELVLAPPEPDNQTACSVSPLKIEKTLSCSNEEDVKKGYVRVDFEGGQYVNFQIADCNLPSAIVPFENLSDIDKRGKCQPFYDLGYRDRVCPTVTPSEPTVQGGEDNGIWPLLAVGVILLACALGWHFYQKRQGPTTQTKEEPADFF